MQSLFFLIIFAECLFLLKHRKKNPHLFINIFYGSILNLLTPVFSIQQNPFILFTCFSIFYIKTSLERCLLDPSSVLNFCNNHKNFTSSLNTKKTTLQLTFFIITAATFLLLNQQLKNNYLPNWVFIFSTSFCAAKTIFIQITNLKKTKNPQNWPFIQTELHSKPNPDFPLYRKTFQFLGNKIVNIKTNSPSPHVIVIFLESFRAENIGCLNAQIPASPHFDRWAKQGILWENFYSTGPQTFRAILSTFFGVLPGLNIPSLNRFKNISFYGLPQIFKKNGYENTIIQSSDLRFDHLESFFLSQQWDNVFGAENFGENHCKISSWGVDDRLCFDKALKQLQQATKPQFISLFTINNHHPWTCPPNWEFKTSEQLSNLQKKFLQTFSYTDHCLGKFLDDLYSYNKFKDCTIVILGDHGQLLDEKGSFSEINFDISEKTLKVPCLLLNESTIQNPQRQSRFASQLDILPTLLDLLDWQEFHHSIGKSLLRDQTSPIFFSSPETIPKFGWIENHQKTIFDGATLQTFNILNDPNELFPHIYKDTNECKHLSFFENLQFLFSQNKLCPSNQNIQASFEAKLHQSPDDCIQTINGSKIFINISLSKCLQITDKIFAQIYPKKALHWRHIDLSNLLITDTTLDFIEKHCRHLNSLQLSNCHLITQKGLIKLLKNCQKIQSLHLENIQIEITDQTFTTSWNFSDLNFKDSPLISSDWIKSFCQNSPNLHSLKLCLKSQPASLLIELKNPAKNLRHLELYQGDNFTSQDLQPFIERLDQLTSLHLEDFSKIEEIQFSHLTNLKSLTLINFPQISINNFNLNALEELKILEIQHCPNLCRRKLSELAKTKNFVLKFL